MNPSRWLVVLFVALAPVSWAAAQVQNNPHIGYAYPAGGRQGETHRIVIGGQYLTGVARVDISGAGIQATVVEHTRPLTGKEFNELREQIRQLQERKTAAMKSRAGGGRGESQPSAEQAKTVEWTAEDERMLAELRRKAAENAPNRQANPAISETVTLDVTVSPNAEPGHREVRLVTPAGLSNPIVFCVGHLPEFTEIESKGNTPAGDPRAAPSGGQARDNEKEMTVTLPAVVNGQIMPGDVDRFRFEARKGQHLVAAASARELVPYLADAVPGWFQAILALYDAEGNELAYADDYRFNPDPVLHCEIPEDGEYVVEIRDSIYRGREDFVYRIAIGEMPFVTSIFPLGGRAGARTRVDVAGWNLPATRVLSDTRNLQPGIHPLSVGKGRRTTTAVPFVVDTLPEGLERESNDSNSGAQQVALPLIVNGRIDRPGDTDVFCFEGRAGARIVAEVCARRLGSPLDSTLRLTDATGRQLAINDDQEDKGAGLTTHHADSYLSVTLPADGTYYIHLVDAQSQGGAEYGYRLRIGPPRPDFELRIVPSSINIRGGATIPLAVYALRRDGFNGDITLAMKDAPAGFLLSGAWVPAGQDQVQVTLTVPRAPTQEPLSLALEGMAVVDGQPIVHPVVPADDMMQAFFYRHLVAAQQLKVAVSGQRMSGGAVSILSEVPLKVPAGGTAQLLLGASAKGYAGGMQLEVTDPPEGITIERITAPRNGTEIVLRSDAAKVKPGQKGNLIVTAFTGRPAAAAGQKPQANTRRTPVGVLPAIPFEIVTAERK